VSEKVGVGDGAVGVTVGVLVDVAVSVGQIKVGVGVKVGVDGCAVGEDCGPVVSTLELDVGVFNGGEAASVGVISIPVNSSPVAHIPMKRPMERYLISARMMGGIFFVGGPIEGGGPVQRGGFDVEVDVIPFGFVPDDVFVVAALPDLYAVQVRVFPEPFGNA